MQTSNIIITLLIAGIGISTIVDVASFGSTTLPADLELTGTMGERTYNALPIKHLNVEGPIRVILTAGLPSHRVTADEGLLDRLADHDDDPESLSLVLPKGANETGDITAYISTPDLETLSLEGTASASSASALPWKKNRLGISGSGSIDFEYSSADNLEMYGSGSTNATLKGRAQHISINVSGSNEVDAEHLLAQVATVKGSGSNNVTVNADSILTAALSGSGQVRYTGGPVVNFNSSGSAKLISF